MSFNPVRRNGAGDGQTHNIYIGQDKRFILRYSWQAQSMLERMNLAHASRLPNMRHGNIR
ncbi:MAG: hypothetical protein ACYCZQ_11780 [Burkholderiales bacterium]